MGRKRAEEDFEYQWLKSYYLRSMRGQWQERQYQDLDEKKLPFSMTMIAIEECDYAVRHDDDLILYEYIRDYATSKEWQRIRSAWRQHRRRHGSTI